MTVEELVTEIKGMMDDGTDAREIVTAMLGIYGLKLTLPQTRYLCADIDTRAETDEKLTLWRSQGENFTIDNFPDFVTEAISKTGKEPLKEILRAVEYVMRKFPEKAVNFCVEDGIPHFNTDGYLYLMSVSCSYGWLSRDEWKRWRGAAVIYDPSDEKGLKIRP